MNFGFLIVTALWLSLSLGVVVTVLTVSRMQFGWFDRHPGWAVMVLIATSGTSFWVCFLSLLVLFGVWR